MQGLPCIGALRPTKAYNAIGPFLATLSRSGWLDPGQYGAATT